MTKSVRRLEAGYLLEHETVETMAMTLGLFETMGDYAYAEEYVDCLARVTPADILRVAGTYLDPEGAGVVAYAPADAVTEMCTPEGLVAAMSEPRSFDEGRPTSRAIREEGGSWVGQEAFTRPHIARETPPASSARRTLSGGATLVVRQFPFVPLVSMAVAFRGGFVNEPDVHLGVTGRRLRLAGRGRDVEEANLAETELA